MSKHIPQIGIVSLGCPKALVDSERILTQLRAEGYEISPTYDGADAVIVNTCGFIDSAKQESFDAIGEALNENGKVIVTGCLGVDEEGIREIHPGVLAVSGPHQYESVLKAVHEVSPPAHDPFMDLVPDGGIKLTPRHYAYLKISEGCNQKCTFCIIPSMRGKLRSRPAGEVLKEAESLALNGVREILLVSQDTGAYGSDLKYAEDDFYGKSVRTKMYDLCNALGDLKVWTRLHYVYPYPHIDDIIPLMAEGKVLPYLDIPFQHASPKILKLMKRPGNQIELLERIKKWREICPEITLRSTFVVGFPGETEEDFEYLLDWLEQAQLDRVGCFKFEPVEGAAANDLPDPVEEDVKEERWNRLMEFQRQISEERMQAKIGKTLEVIIDEVDDQGSIGRTKGDAPEIDGEVYINGECDLEPGQIVRVKVEHAEDYDLWGSLVD
ncbi:30S ribosomal protein S12 methylthiotransferase RimO [Terasakiella sp. A23]|uniref:30S ribosomal protein S12 methylthiotransferase RimO n=1 Tax=Terasakiella sp. FCG-A23 TaxID=3080561 RepID=UPI002955394A|nr:30S ribosomal protein S12 methylthiotransferase RimO [Terasakiella sp. A23]MDV7338680.1 30S ribosomal protein S12 methylthiotransferase RimO [Terasakiella sp. A23]